MRVRRGRAPRDWDTASQQVAEAYFPHELRPLGGCREPRLTLHTLDLGPVLIGHVGWGSDVSIECDYPGAYEINLPMTGHLESRGRHGTLTSVPGQGTVFRSDTPSLISHWDATCTVLGVKFDSRWLDREAERVLGGDRTGLRAELPDQLNVAAGTPRSWHQLIGSLAANLHDPAAFSVGPVREQLAGAVAAGFLLAAVPEGGTGPPARPPAIRRLLDQLHDDPARAWTAGEMAAVAGTSVRRLQEGFRRWVGSSPTAYLTEIRLRRAHANLVTAPSATVSEVAARWGFSSASRFAAAYRRLYGIPPSQARD